jgi:hypothetical protein
MNTTLEELKDSHPAPESVPTINWRRPFEYIAFWQFLAFILLVCLVWANEVLDFPAMFYGDKSGRLDWIGASILTVIIIITGFITIAHTYVQQRRAIRGIITICSYCKKVQIDKEIWQRIESYVSHNTDAEFTHGICPECYFKLTGEDAPEETTIGGDRITSYVPPETF